jgi:hypothetical protein
MTYFELIRALKIPRSVRRELLALLRLPRHEALAVLEHLIGELVSHRRIYESKRRKQLEHRIVWGRELEENILRYMRAGKCLRTATILAGQDFRQAHPQNAEDGAIPGHSTPALLRYRTAYRQNRKP